MLVLIMSYINKLPVRVFIDNNFNLFTFMPKFALYTVYRVIFVRLIFFKRLSLTKVNLT